MTARLQEVAFQREHVAELETAEHIAGVEADADSLDALAASPWASTLLADGRPVACYGVALYWRGRGEAWALVDKHRGGRHALPLHRAALRILRTCGVARVEAVVRCDLPTGRRWALDLGFVVETERMPKYHPDGGACARYVRIAGPP